MANYYPIYIDIQEKSVLVVGGGLVALRKVETLLAYGALVRIVSPAAVPGIERLIDGVRCQWIKKEYAPEDIKDVVLVFSCTDKEEVNNQVAKDAKARFRPVNSVDDPANCSFIVPSIMKKGDLAIAVSTGGSSPLMARLIRQEIEEIYGEEMEAYLGLLRGWRQEVKQKLPVDKRSVFWGSVTDGRILSLVRKGQFGQAKEVIEDCFQSLLD